MDTPIISVITVSYNAVTSIEKTMLSVLNQIYDRVEYIIIDGGSVDGTLEMIQKYVDRLGYWVSEPDKGIYDAMNKGILNASGDWIIFMNCGDIFVDENVLYSLFYGKKYENIDVLYGDALEVDSNGRRRLLKARDSKSNNIPPAYRHGASFVRREIHKTFLFDLSRRDLFSYGLDYDCICRMYRANKSFKYCNIIIMEYLKDGISNHPLKNIWLRKLIEHNGDRGISFYKDLLFYFPCGIYRRLKRFITK